MSENPIDRVAVIRQSLAACGCGCACLAAAFGTGLAVLVVKNWSGEDTAKHPEVFIPAIGLAAVTVIAAAQALIYWARVTFRFRNEWNPASAYLSWGARLACIGLMISTLIIGVLLVA
jgi:hypothetical protein